MRSCPIAGPFRPDNASYSLADPSPKWCSCDAYRFPELAPVLALTLLHSSCGAREMPHRCSRSRQRLEEFARKCECWRRVELPACRPALPSLPEADQGNRLCTGACIVAEDQIGASAAWRSRNKYEGCVTGRVRCEHWWAACARSNGEIGRILTGNRDTRNVDRFRAGVTGIDHSGAARLAHRVSSKSPGSFGEN